MSRFILVLLYSCLIIRISPTVTPMYKYLKDLCPPGLLPLTGSKHVYTCEDSCPSGSNCIRGICCIQQPSCHHLIYTYSSQFSCLPKIKQNCPSGLKCVPSNRDKMSICCSIKPLKEPSLTTKQGICPVSHPVISYENHHIKLCKDCKNGICVPFRNSSVSVCCHSFDQLCGSDSSVEMDGLLARDCSTRTCSDGFECSLSPSGAQLCCSYAQCSTGARARAVCAAGCRRNERCEDIGGERWCCSKKETEVKCPRNTIRELFFALIYSFSFKQNLEL